MRFLEEADKDVNEEEGAKEDSSEGGDLEGCLRGYFFLLLLGISSILLLTVWKYSEFSKHRTQTYQ